MSRRFVAPLLALTLSTGLVLGAAIPSNAAPVTAASSVQTAAPAPTKVTINKIKTAKMAPKTKLATVKPSVKSTGQAKVTSSKLTVKQGKKTVAKNVSAAKLRAGRYSVTTTAKYKTWRMVETSKTVTTKKLAAKKGNGVSVTCRFKDSVPGVGPLGYFTGNPADRVSVDVLLVTTACTGGFDGSFVVQGISVPATAENIALDADGYYDWDPAFVPDGDAFAYVPEHAGEVVKLKVLAPRDLHKSTKSIQTSMSRVWSKEKTKTATQALTVKK